MPSYDDDGIGRVEVRRLGVSRARRTRSSTWRRDLGSGPDVLAVQVIGPIPVCRPAQIGARQILICSFLSTEGRRSIYRLRDSNLETLTLSACVRASPLYRVFAYPR